MRNEPLKYFKYEHLPESLAATAKPFCRLAEIVVKTLPECTERSACLRKLLEAKDCAVRSNLDATGGRD